MVAPAFAWCIRFKPWARSSPAEISNEKPAGSACTGRQRPCRNLRIGLRDFYCRESSDSARSLCSGKHGRSDADFSMAERMARRIAGIDALAGLRFLERVNHFRGV